MHQGPATVPGSSISLAEKPPPVGIGEIVLYAIRDDVERPAIVVAIDTEQVATLTVFLDRSDTEGTVIRLGPVDRARGEGPERFHWRPR